MTGGSYSRLVQQYRPSGLSSADHVSVSGLDLSLDRRELLVSYESDQIYSFPVFPGVKSKSGPTMDQLDYMSKETEADHKEDKIISELTTYGAHLNRFTFLKVNSRMLCSRSDSSSFFTQLSFSFFSDCHARTQGMRVRMMSIFVQGLTRVMRGFMRGQQDLCPHYSMPIIPLATALSRTQYYLCLLRMAL